jgi:hypothetical protein
MFCYFFWFFFPALAPLSLCLEAEIHTPQLEEVSESRPLGLTSSMTEYNPSLLLEHSQRKEVCTFIVVGAMWDGHFKYWLRRSGWKRIERILSYSETSRRARIELGYFLYNDQALPQITSDTWPYPSIGSYEIVMLKDGRTLQREAVNQLFRPPHTHEKYDDGELLELLERICLEEGMMEVKEL